MTAQHLALRWWRLCIGLSNAQTASNGLAAQTWAVVQRTRDSGLGQVKTWLVVALLGLGTAQAQTVQCRIESGGETSHLTMSPVPDAYALNSVDLPNGFRVSAQWLSVTQRLKTYVYYTASHVPVLISQQVLVLPVSMCTAPFSQQIVYAGKIERELTLTCQLQCQ